MFIATLIGYLRSTEESSTEIQRRFGFVRLETRVFGEDEPGGYGIEGTAMMTEERLQDSDKTHQL